MIAYNADDAALYGVLYHYPATQNNPTDEVLQIYDWDTGVSTRGSDNALECWRAYMHVHLRTNGCGENPTIEKVFGLDSIRSQFLSVCVCLRAT
jgi:hypothetical protein